MKTVSLWFILALMATPLAQAQVHFDSGSAVPRDAGPGTRRIARHEGAAAQRYTGAGKVRCRDGSRHIPRVCSRHGGIGGR